MPKQIQSVSIDVAINYGEEIKYASFDNVYSFAEFLKGNPEVADWLGYKIKGPVSTVKYPVGGQYTSLRRGSAYNTSKKAAMQLRTEVEGMERRGEIKMKPGWDKNLP